MAATQILGFLGILFIIGFVGDHLFRKIGFPDILALLALGYVVGPVLHIVDPTWAAPGNANNS
jgi:Kef-type K+ transport system membrane component KefB